MGTVMSENQIVEFLTEGRTNLQLGTVDRKGDAIIQPVWFYYDVPTEKIYVTTDRGSLKTRNIRRKNSVYFSVDEDGAPYRCVKGKARANISETPEQNVDRVREIAVKYLGSVGDPSAARLLSMAKSGQSVVLELVPQYFSTWSFGG